jgi:WD40 repeat protein
VTALDISADGEILASGSYDCTVILWDTSTWKRKGHPLFCGSPIRDIRFSPTGQLGVATNEDIQIWDLDQKKRLTQFKGHNEFNGINAINASLAWTPDGAHLLSAGDGLDPVIRSWDTSTWKQAGDPWIGHDKHINQIILNPAGTLLASASGDCTVRLWQFSTGTELARFRHSDEVICVAFSVDGRSIFSGGNDKKISQWEIPEDVLAAVECDALASAKNEAARSKHNMKRLLHSEIPDQRRNKSATSQRFTTSQGWATHSASPFTHAESPSSSRLFDLKTFFNGMRPSSDNKGKKKE